MAVNIERSMNAELVLGAVDHTINTAQGQDLGGVVEPTSAAMRQHLVGRPFGYAGAWPAMTGEHLIPAYLRGLVRGY